MQSKFRIGFVNMIKQLYLFGIDLRSVYNLRNYPKYIFQKIKWKKSGGKITKSLVVLNDYDLNSGINKGHYFHQDLIVAQLIFKNNPQKHIDIGSRVDGFVSHVASFRLIEVFDIRPMPTSFHSNIKFTQLDLSKSNKINLTDSLSCLHTVEHFGLGRYGDDIDIDGHIKGINILVKMLKSKGRLYISLPIGVKNEVHFNAHRIFHPQYLLSVQIIKNELSLLRFDYIDDDGDVYLDVKIKNAIDKTTYGCGIYTFQKK